MHTLFVITIHGLQWPLQASNDPQWPQDHLLTMYWPRLEAIFGIQMHQKKCVCFPKKMHTLLTITIHGLQWPLQASNDPQWPHDHLLTTYWPRLEAIFGIQMHQKKCVYFPKKMHTLFTITISGLQWPLQTSNDPKWPQNHLLTSIGGHF